MEYKKYKRLCFLDTETTNVYWNTAAPVQIAGMITDNHGNVLETFNEKIKTTHQIDPEASEVHHIYAKDLVNCRSEQEVLKDFVSWMLGSGVDVIITYNGKAFDVPMLNERCKVLPELNNIHIFDKMSDERIPHIDGYYDCVYLAKKRNLRGLKDKLGRKWRLSLVSEFLNISNENAHDALADITMLKNIFFVLDPEVNPTNWTFEEEEANKIEAITVESLF